LACKSCCACQLAALQPILNIGSEFSSRQQGTGNNPGALLARSLTRQKGIDMSKLSYLLAAAAAIAIASPTFAQDTTKAGAGVSINQGSTSVGATSGGEVKRDAGRSERRGDMRREDARAQGGIEVRGERREGMRGEDRREYREGLRGEGRGVRRGIHVRIGEVGYPERRWHRAHAERVVIIKNRRHHHHHRHYIHD
jgi:hypothetical protein